MPRHDGFVAHASGSDQELAIALQRGLSQLARPWTRRRSLDVFADGGDRGGGEGEGLSASTTTALDNSNWFVLLASPESARSEAVGRQITRWIETRGMDHFLPVLTAGIFEWDDATNDLAWSRSTAAHPALRGAFSEIPRHIDLSWARGSNELSLRNARFRDAVAEIGAPMHGLSKDELDSEDIRRFRRRRRLARVGVTAVAVLTVVAMAGAVIAVVSSREAARQRDQAVVQARIATAANLAATVMSGQLSREVGFVVAAHAYDLDAAAGRAALWSALRTAELDGQGEEQHLTTWERTGQPLALARNGATFDVPDGLSTDVHVLAVSTEGSVYVAVDTAADVYALIGTDGQVLANLQTIAPSSDPAAIRDPAIATDMISSGSSGARQFQFSNENKQVYSVDAAGVLTLWSSADGRLLWSKPDVRDVQQLDNELLVLTVDSIVGIDVDSGTPVRAKQAPTGAARSIASNGEQLAIGTSSGRIIVSDLESGEPTHDIDANVGIALHLSMSSDGTWLGVTGPSSYSVIDLQGGTLLFTELTPLDTLRQVLLPIGLVFDDSANSLVLDTGQGVLTVSLGAEGWRHRACELAGRDLTTDEFATIVGGPFEVTCG